MAIESKGEVIYLEHNLKLHSHTLQMLHFFTVLNPVSKGKELVLVGHLHNMVRVGEVKMSH